MTGKDYAIFGPEERFNIPQDEGHFMLELFRVKINGRGQGHLSGRVLTNDGIFKDILYDQVKQPIRITDELEGDDLLLIGPPGYMVAYDSLTLYFNLQLWNNSSSFQQGVPDDIISDMISWHSSFNAHNLNQLLCCLIEGRNGILSATVFYAVFETAIETSVEVTLIDKENPVVAVYGIVAARNDMIPAVADDDYESVLFLKDSDESVQVGFGEPIPFSRSVVAVPLQSNLIVHLHLLHNQENRSSNSLFPRAKIAFPPKLSGISEREIYDKIKVKVTWRDYFRD